VWARFYQKKIKHFSHLIIKLLKAKMFKSFHYNIVAKISQYRPTENRLSQRYFDSSNLYREEMGSNLDGPSNGEADAS
jgi:hypothetical protein